MPVMKALNIDGTTYTTTGEVTVTQTLTSGTEIGSIDVDGTSTTLYAPESSGGGGLNKMTLYTSNVDSTGVTLYADADKTISLIEAYNYSPGAVWQALTAVDAVEVIGTGAYMGATITIIMPVVSMYFNPMALEYTLKVVNASGKIVSAT